MDKNCTKSEKCKIMSAEYGLQISDEMWPRVDFFLWLGSPIVSC